MVQPLAPSARSAGPEVCSTVVHLEKSRRVLCVKSASCFAGRSWWGIPHWKRAPTTAAPERDRLPSGCRWRRWPRGAAAIRSRGWSPIGERTAIGLILEHMGVRGQNTDRNSEESFRRQASEGAGCGSCVRGPTPGAAGCSCIRHRRRRLLGLRPRYPAASSCSGRELRAGSGEHVRRGGGNRLPVPASFILRDPSRSAKSPPYESWL